MPEATPPAGEGETNLRWSDALISGLAAAGMKLAVISPGSRSTPLVLACQRHPHVATRVHVDERSAAFFALGVAKVSREPVALIATSGSAAAHWLPAVIEASHSNTPLLLLSADRPPDLHACGANQTTNQLGFFSNHLRGLYQPIMATADADALSGIARLGEAAAKTSRQPRAGPVQINLPFREPLIPGQPVELPECRPGLSIARTLVAPSRRALRQLCKRISGRPGIIVCGPATDAEPAPESVTRLAQRLGAPIFADPLSGLRFGSHPLAQVISRYDSFLRSPSAGDSPAPDWVLQFGAAPVSKSLHRYLVGHRAPLILCSASGDLHDPNHLAVQRISSDPALLCQALIDAGVEPVASHWLTRFQRLESAAEAEARSATGLPTEALLIAQLLHQLPAESRLFSGNSLPIRQLDSWSGRGEKPLVIQANRGISGIDGNISTLAGMAAASDRPLAGLIGDLAFYHDMNGLLPAREEALVLIVLNNGGGAIFDYLPQAQLADFDRYWRTPIDLDYSHAAALYGIPHSRTREAEGFSDLLQTALSAGGCRMIEVMVDPKASQAAHQAYWSRLAANIECD